LSLWLPSLAFFRGSHTTNFVTCYLTITKDLGRVMSRVKAIYRSWAIPCTGKQVYAPRHRVEWSGARTRIGYLMVLMRGRCATRNGLSCYFGPRRCWTKNSHITLVALISLVVRPTIHSGKGLPPGQVWPPPSTV
jgi:hypothetical protein